MGITGKWKIIEAELGGQKLPASGFEKLVLEMDENSYQLIEDKVIDSGLLQLIPGLLYPGMVLTPLFGPNKGRIFHCIYQLEKEDIIMCYNLEGDTPPASFQTFPDTLLYMARYRRMADL
jgi:uncharacterized protein (TIGR03067 family)